MVSSQEQPGVVMHGKSVVVINTKTLYREFCCALIGDEGEKVYFQTAGAFDIQLYSNVCLWERFEAGMYFRTPR